MERMLNGKHYNNATRVLKTLYDALTRCRTKQFRIWMLEKNNDLRKLTESREFQSCLHEVKKKFLVYLIVLNFRGN